jgi:hypothetical protein
VTHMPRRASEATAKVGRWRRADDRAVRHRAGCAEGADPAPTIGAIFFCSSVSPHGRPALFPNAAWASFHNSKGHRNVDTCAFFLFRPAFVASDRFYSGPNRL